MMSALCPLGTVRKVLPRPVLRVHRAWTLAERGLMWPPHKANVRCFSTACSRASRAQPVANVKVSVEASGVQHELLVLHDLPFELKLHSFSAEAELAVDSILGLRHLDLPIFAECRESFMIGGFKLSAGPFGREQLLRVSTIPGLRHRGRCRFDVHEGVPVVAQLAPRVPPALSKRCSTCVFWEFTELAPVREGVHAASPQGLFSRVRRRQLQGPLQLWTAFRGGPKWVFWSLRCAIVHFWLRPSKRPFLLVYVQELAHRWPFV